MLEEAKIDLEGELGLLLREWLIRKLPEGSSLKQREVSKYINQNLRLPADEERYQYAYPEMSSKFLSWLPRIQHLEELALKSFAAEEATDELRAENSRLREEATMLQASLEEATTSMVRMSSSLEFARQELRDFENVPYAEVVASLATEVAKGEEAAQTIFRQRQLMQEIEVRRHLEVKKLWEEKKNDEREMAAMWRYVVADLQQYVLTNTRTDASLFQGFKTMESAQTGLDLHR